MILQLMQFQLCAVGIEPLTLLKKRKLLILRIGRTTKPVIRSTEVRRRYPNVVQFNKFISLFPKELPVACAK
jgi:hypothetical protein